MTRLLEKVKGIYIRYALILLNYRGSLPFRGFVKCRDMACIPSIFIKTSQIFFGESCLMSAFTKNFLGKLRMIAIGPRGH